MKSNFKELINIVNEWVIIADEDLKYAKLGLKISTGVSYRIISFHSQQCAEKYLKAYLVFSNTEFPYTHNITTLLDLCSLIDVAFESLRDSEILTSYATANRYPGAYRKLKKTDAVSAIKLASKVRLKVRKKLVELGFKFSK